MQTISSSVRLLLTSVSLGSLRELLRSELTYLLTYKLYIRFALIDFDTQLNFTCRYASLIHSPDCKHGMRSWLQFRNQPVRLQSVCQSVYGSVQVWHSSPWPLNLDVNLELRTWSFNDLAFLKSDTRDRRIRGPHCCSLAIIIQTNGRTTLPTAREAPGFH